jgi:hypothetical protein
MINCVSIKIIAKFLRTIFTSFYVLESVKYIGFTYQSLYKHKYDASILGYDIYNCPATPPNNYPMSWTVTEVLTNWSPLHVVTTKTSQPRYVHQGHQ